MSAPVGRVYVCDPEHPHYGESGHFTGSVILLLGEHMAEVALDDCKRLSQKGTVTSSNGVFGLK